MKYEVKKGIVIENDNDHMAKSYKLGNFYEETLLKDIVRYDGAYVDVGAHVGNHALYVAKYGKFSQIICFEPCLKHFLKLKSNMRRNNVLNAYCYATAIGSGFGRGHTVEKGPNDGSYTFEESEPFHTEIDSLDNQLRIFANKIGVIKIDVEGYEMKVLHGAYETILKHSPVVYVELNWNRDLIISWFNSNGYILVKEFKLGSPIGKFTNS